MSRRPRPVRAAALVVALAGCGEDGRDAPRPPDPAIPAAPGHAAQEEERRFLAEIDRSRGVRDCFLPLRDPAFVAVDGPHGLTDAEMVIGVDLAAEGAAAQFAYPTQYLDFHEIVEHEVPTELTSGVGERGTLHLLACW